MAMWFASNFATVNQLCKSIERMTAGEELVMYYSPSALKHEVMMAFKMAFPWHYRDTKRSYTSPNLRSSGNNGKKTDFAYRHRVKKHFGYDQLEMHRHQRNKLICLWDPTQRPRGDIIGEHNPCLVMVKFKDRGDRLDMVAIFRKRDLCRRMIGNMIMLIYWLEEEAALRHKSAGFVCDMSMETQWAKDDVKALRNAGVLTKERK